MVIGPFLQKSRRWQYYVSILGHFADKRGNVDIIRHLTQGFIPSPRPGRRHIKVTIKSDSHLYGIWTTIKYRVGHLIGSRCGYREQVGFSGIQPRLSFTRPGYIILDWFRHIPVVRGFLIYHPAGNINTTHQGIQAEYGIAGVRPVRPTGRSSAYPGNRRFGAGELPGYLPDSISIDTGY